MEYGKKIAEFAAVMHPSEIIRRFDLKEYCNQQKRLRISSQSRRVIDRYSFTIDPSSKLLTQIFAKIYELSMDFYTGEKLPVLLVTMGREYSNDSFFQTVGNCTDIIPLLIEKDTDEEDIMDKMKYIKKKNINFTALDSSDDKEKQLLNSIINSNIIVNIQGIGSDIPKAMDSDDFYKRAVNRKDSVLYIIRYDSNIEIIRIRPGDEEDVEKG